LSELGAWSDRRVRFDFDWDIPRENLQKLCYPRLLQHWFAASYDQSSEGLLGKFFGKRRYCGGAALFCQVEARAIPRVRRVAVGAFQIAARQAQKRTRHAGAWTLALETPENLRDS